MKHIIKSILLLTLLSCIACDEMKYHRDPVSDQILIDDQLELVAAKAGLYANYQPFPPMVILKFKNVSDSDYKGDLYLKVVFIKENNVVCDNNAFLSGPIPAGTTKQVAIKCHNYGLTVDGKMGRFHYTVNVYDANDELLKTIDFTGATKEWLESERIK